MFISFTTLGFSFCILRLIKLSFCCFFFGRNGRTARQPSSASTPRKGNNRSHSETKHVDLLVCSALVIELKQHISSLRLFFVYSLLFTSQLFICKTITNTIKPPIPRTTWFHLWANLRLVKWKTKFSEIGPISNILSQYPH